MQLIIHRGTYQIGGSCVEVQTADTRILLDFGMPLYDSTGSDFNERNIEGKSVEKLIKENVLFDIKGLYRNSTPSIDAVLISHSHKDHYGFLPYINPKIPIYLSKGAYELVNALNVFLPESKRTNINNPIFLRHNRLLKIGGFQIKPYLVDHSGFDAMGFLITEVPTGKTILYTGDFRAGGWTKKRFDDFIKNPPKSVDCLLMEGTMLAREGGKYPGETAVVQGVVAVIKESANAVIPVYCSGQNIDRIVSLYKAALKTKSILVVDPYTAYMLKVAGKISKHIPQIEWDNIRVFLANYGKGDIYINKISKTKDNQMMISLGRKKIKAFDFANLKQKVLLLMRNTMIPVVENIPQIQGSTIIYSQWEGYIKKDTVDAKKFWSFVKRNKLKVEHIHTSGHATLDKLKEFASKVNARQIVPIHTEYPERFKDHFGPNVVRYKDGQSFEV
ncbi:MAG: MBL fold metallo-hydrolase [Candidatus Omnitrophica bacterium]|nr:MBL fold metallo-hydrolase [Candidatus Omnitrophota bacterium]